MASPNYVFNTHPMQMRNYIGKHVNIKTVNKHTYSGHIHVIDPESLTVVLFTKHNSHAKVNVISYNTIISFDVDEEQSTTDELFKSKTDINDNEVNQKRKLHVKSWLELNLIAIAEDGDNLKVGEFITMTPPYRIEDCYCSNTIVLDRFRNIMETMPKSEN